MNVVFQIAIENALVVALLAPLVWALSRLLRRPALTHALWLIVLIKLVTPPIYRPAITLPQRQDQPREIALDLRPENDSPPDWQIQSEASTTSRITDATGALSTPHVTIDSAQTAPSRSHAAQSFKAFIPVVEFAWLAGAFVFLSIALARIIRFSRILRNAYPAPPELQSRVGQLSRRLGLRSAPAVYFIPGSLCPMLWAVGGSPRLLIPVALWGRLDPGERDTILLHELAHWRRRDHWVRWIELAATTIYWWNPVCWIARRELREAEEQCCDAWVLHATGDFKPYANALLRAVEFISNPTASSTQHKPLPALASGMGQFNHLKRRIVMLKTASVARALSPRTLVAALGFSAVLLPLSPSLRGAPQEAPPRQLEIDTKPLEQRWEVKATTAFARDQVPVTLNEIALDDASPEDQLAAAKKEIAELRQRLAQAEARLSVYKARDQGMASRTDAPANIIVRPTNKNQNSNGQQQQSAGVREGVADSAIEQAVGGVADVVEGGVGHVIRAAVRAGQYGVELGDRTVRLDGPGVHDGKYRTIITDRDTGRIMEIRENALTPPATAQQADRLDKLEAQLRDLLKELDSIRHQSTTSETHDLPAKK